MPLLVFVIGALAITLVISGTTKPFGPIWDKETQKRREEWNKQQIIDRNRKH